MCRIQSVRCNSISIFTLRFKSSTYPLLVIYHKTYKVTLLKQSTQDAYIRTKPGQLFSRILTAEKLQNIGDVESFQLLGIW